MVYVNNKKFACESCIKGHRSSSCRHNDRPLFEIKKKGRPVSQCDRCRELRQSKKVHSKCTCTPKEDVQVLRVSTGTKSKRYIPIVPALPNGLKDLMQASSSSSILPPDVRQRVDTLLNPCTCKNVWKCKCRTTPRPSLDLLADAAAMQDAPNTATSVELALPESRSLTPRPNSPKRAQYKDVKADLPFELPPILDISSASSSQAPGPIPSFPIMPPISEISSLAGSECTCGLRCACPGCVTHRGAEHAAKDRKDCADGCGTCVDHSSGIALPTHEHTSGTPAALTYLDQFFARAASLPSPPTNRRTGSNAMRLDPMNVTVYPDAARASGERGLAFGLVNVPKLECCGGRCGCPNGRCACGKACDGCCEDHRNERSQASSRAPSQPLMEPVQSCCAAKASPC